MPRDVLVVIGTGGMGQAIAGRLGPGSRLLLADIDRPGLAALTARLSDEGYEVVPAVVDVTSGEAVARLAEQAASLGPVRRVVHTAGLSPVQASVSQILAVDLVGVALVAEIFAGVVAHGGAGVVIASMAGHSCRPLRAEEVTQLARTPAAELLSLPITDPVTFPNSADAYIFAKRASQIRVQAASVTWGARGARINSISPGVIATAQGRAELDSEYGPIMRAMIDGSNARRVGTAADIAAAADFLLSPAADFISGADLLVDGGATAFTTGGV